MNYFDIHSHPYFPDFDADRDEVISRMKEQGIWTTAIGTDLESSRKSIELAEAHENIYATVGVHPDESTETFAPEFEEMARHPKVVAMGECGFDFFRTEAGDMESTRARQKKIFEAQIDLALRNKKSLMLHGRPSKGSMNAYEDMLDVLETYAAQHGELLRGNAHFFVGSEDILRRFLDIGFTVSFTGVITFVRDYDGLVQYAPVDRIHAETDAPFVPPLSVRTQKRNGRNSSEYIPEIVEMLAKIRAAGSTQPYSGDSEDLKQQLVINAKRLFGLM